MNYIDYFMSLNQIDNDFKKVVALQIDNNNKTVGKDWQIKNLAWHRAIYAEAVELFDSTAWKWWKFETCDHDNIKMEYVDILHFLVSWAIIKEELEFLHECLSDKYITRNSIHKSIDNVIKYSADRTLMYTIESFCELKEHIFDDTKDIYDLYFAKNWLNGFRQENGYKDGVYKKIINGKEDNKILTELVILHGLETAKQKFAELYREAKK